MEMDERKAYGQILRSSALMGGAQAINYVIGLLRVKAVALLLGPSGVGLVALYTSATTTVGAVTGLGIQRSAVRAIAIAQGNEDPIAVARAIRMLRRLCWATGLLGWIACLALALPLSRLMFESTVHAPALGLLGGTVFLAAISGGQMALLRGLRRIGDIARIQVAGAAVNTVVIIGLYAWLRERGIVPVLLASAAISLATSWWFARRVRIDAPPMGWREALEEAKPMVSLGFALMFATVMASLLELYTRTVLGRTLGVDAVGIYQAAWSLSGMFAGFVLSAMGTDFYPRLAAVIDDRVAAIREINAQTEIGLLLVLPGLLATLAFSKWVVWALYSAKFTPAGDVLVWMILGVYGRVLSWPLGYVQVAMNEGRWYVATEAFFIAIQALLVTWWTPLFGVMGAAYAFLACYVLYFLGMLVVARGLIGFRHAPDTLRLILVSVALILPAMLANRLLGEWPALAIGTLATAVGSGWCLRELAHRLGPSHRIIRMASRVPGLTRLLKQRHD